MSAPAENQNAAKADAAKVAHPVNVRGTETERKRWRRNAAGGKWNEWARAALNAACRKP